MTLETAESKDPSPTDESIEDALRKLDGASNHFAILSIDEMTYMQASGSAETGFVIEYQDGALDEHFKSTDTAIPLERVSKAFQSYLRRDDKWKSEFEWEKDEAVAGGGCASALFALLIVPGAVSVVSWLVTRQ